MQDVLEPGIWGQVNSVTIGIVLGSSEAWQEMKIGWSISTESLRKESQDLK